MTNVEEYHVKWMEKALELAENALRLQEVPVGCIIVYKERIIAKGGNEVNHTKNATRHAEIIAIEEARELCKKEDLSEQEVFQSSTLYVTVEPCIMCAGALRQMSLPLVVFGCPNERFGGCGSVIDVAGDKTISDNIGRNFDIIKGVLAEEAVTLLKNFYRGENPSAPEEKRKVKGKIS